MQWTDEVKIETPEQIDLSLEIAGVGSRLAAQCYDWTAKWTIVLLLFCGLLFAAWGLGFTGLLEAGAGPILLGIWLFISFVFFIGYDILFEAYKNGQTPGKKQLGIRVIREGGSPVDFSAAAIRNLVGIADFLPAFYLLGGTLLLLNKQAQRLGDMAAGTIVIRERSDKLVADPRLAGLPAGADEFAFLETQLARLSADDRIVLRSYCARYPSMAPEPRYQLAMRLFSRFIDKIGYELASPIVESERAEAFLLKLYHELELRRKHE